MSRLLLVSLLAVTATANERQWLVAQADVIVIGVLRNHEVTFEGRDARVTGEILVRRYVYGPDRSIRRIRYDSTCDECAPDEARDEWLEGLRHGLLQPGYWFLTPERDGLHRGAGTNSGMGWQPLHSYSVKEILEVKERRSLTR